MRAVRARLWISVPSFTGSNGLYDSSLRPRERDLEYLEADLECNLVGDLEGNREVASSIVSESCSMAETPPLIDS
jgi:hypothetical protein